MTDYKNGYVIRFADDFVITARTQQDAINFKNVIEEKFLKGRGLAFSEEKTKIVKITKGFEFLSRFYYKSDRILHCVPTEEAIKDFENRLSEMIFSPEKKWSQKSLIMALNQKLNGWASYHRVEESKDAFKHIDLIVDVLLIRLMKKMYPKLSQKQIERKFWVKSSDGKFFFALSTNPEIRVVKLEDVILRKGQELDIYKNPFLNKEYFDELEDNIEIRNVTGKYKTIWTRQNGLCGICNRKIEPNQERTIIYKKLSKDKTIRNMIYIHRKCKDSELIYIKYNTEEFKNKDLLDYIEEINLSEENNQKVKKKPSKFDKLTTYFHNSKKSKITLKFSDIEKIIGSKLCNSAYKHISYFYNHSDERAIANSWVSQDYKISKFDLENQTIYFTKNKTGKPRVIIPNYILKSNIPVEAKYEIENFFAKMKEKYKL